MKHILLASLAAFSLSACGKDSPSVPEVITPGDLMEHLEYRKVCIGGFQMFEVKDRNDQVDYVKVPKSTSSSNPVWCDRRTSKNGEQL